MGKNKDNAEKIARLAKALAHPTRIMILHFLAKQESCFFGDISEIVAVSKATMSQHLSELKNAGLIIGEVLPPKSVYCIDRKAWGEVKELFGSLIEACCEEKKCGCR